MRLQCIRPALYKMQKEEETELPTFTAVMWAWNWYRLREVLLFMRKKTRNPELTQEQLVRGFATMYGHFYGSIKVTLVGLSSTKGTIVNIDRDPKDLSLNPDYEYVIPEAWGSRMMDGRHNLEKIFRVTPVFEGEHTSTVLRKLEGFDSSGKFVRALSGSACPWLAPAIKAK